MFVKTGGWSKQSKHRRMNAGPKYTREVKISRRAHYSEKGALLCSQTVVAKEAARTIRQRERCRVLALLLMRWSRCVDHKVLGGGKAHPPITQLTSHTDRDASNTDARGLFQIWLGLSLLWVSPLLLALLMHLSLLYFVSYIFKWKKCQYNIKKEKNSETKRCFLYIF